MKACIFSFFCLLLVARAETVEYDLVVAEEIRSPAGKPVRVLTVNGSLPGPTLRFREGDLAIIRVHNRLLREDTSTHWHGLLLPNEQDGVPHLTTPPILPGTTHVFQFPLRHAGTYWYHSHTHLQEQIGVYGSIVVTPRAGEREATDRDHVVLLSDWSNERPEEVHRTLMRGSDYYGIKRRNAQSIAGAIRGGFLKDYFQREWTRMPPMDISDVGYDAFLINGMRTNYLEGRPGELMKLRIINASASTYFYLQSSTGPLRIVAADGPPVEPVEVDRLLIAIAETYDVLVRIPESGQWELRATAQDGSRHASARFGDGEFHPASDPPRPNLYSMDGMLNMWLAEQEADPRAVLQLPRPGPPYRLLRAPESTALNPDVKPRRILMRLTGDMNRYVWSIDGKTIAEEPYVPIRRGEIIQLEVVNNTMMHHPIHLHGHFVRLLTDAGDRSPWKHTVDIPPMGRRTVEFEATEDRDWMFHCHILYHMMSGMGRVFRYESESAPNATGAEALVPLADHGKENHAGHGMPSASPVAQTSKPHHSGHSGHSGHASGLGEHSHDMWFRWGAVSAQSHMTEGFYTFMNARNNLTASWEAGWARVEDPVYELDATYQRYFNANVQAFVGGRFTNEEGLDHRGIAGFNYRLPLFVWMTASLDTRGDVRLGLFKRFQVTSRLGVFGRGEFDMRSRWEYAAGADFTLNKPVSLVAQFHSRFGPGVGLLIRF